MADQNEKAPLFDTAERFILDSNSPVPLYHQMEQILQSRISQEDSVGRMLPPEKDLMIIFGVSRATVKRTLDNLSNKGLIERRRALGTKVVRHREITEDLVRLTSYTEEMRRMGLTVKSEMLSVREHVPDEEISERLQIDPDEKTLQLRRRRGTNEIFPVVLLCSEIPISYGIRADEDLSGSLYSIIEDRHKIPIESAEEIIRARKATRQEADLLDLKKGEGVLVMERTTFTLNGRPLEFVRGVYRPEYYKFHVRLRRG